MEKKRKPRYLYLKHWVPPNLCPAFSEIRYYGTPDLALEKRIGSCTIQEKCSNVNKLFLPENSTMPITEDNCLRHRLLIKKNLDTCTVILVYHKKNFSKKLEQRKQ